MAIALGLVLATFAFMRTYAQHTNVTGSLIVSLSLAVIVVISVLLGSTMPVILQKFKIDPAHAAGPILATLIDVVGLFVYCAISRIILG